MLFYFGFYSSLLLIFFVHGLVYAAICLRKSRVTENKSFAWLALYLLLSVLFITPWMLGFAGWYDEQPYKDILLYTPTHFSWAIGPVMFIYVQCLFNPSYRFKGKQWWHLAPLGLYLLIHLFIFLHDRIFRAEPLLLAAGVDPDFTDFNQLPGLFSMIVYFVLALRYYKLYRQLMVQVVSYADMLLFTWVRNFLLAFLSFVVLTLLFGILGLLFEVNYTGSWWYYLSFAIIFYYIAINGYSNALETTVAFQPNLLSYRPAILLGMPKARDNREEPPAVEDIDFIEIGKPGNTNPDIDFPLDSWKEKVFEQVVIKKGYEDPELSLMGLAGMLKTNPSLLSKVINQGFGKNFNDFVNHYRVASLQNKLRNGEQQHQTLLSLAFECGFNSKATFNRAFQKHTGVSPREWMKTLS